MTDQGTPPTESLRPGSDPSEIQRRFRESRPERIGPYRILETLGEGGMGTVYLAEQEQPIRRRVALKIIKLGMDTRQVIARFEAERQALALMSHANVARVFDAGTTETGQPYFVMEHVEGMPITKYCDKHHLGTADRLRLFSAVCMAVQHAHQKGIIHRDIKPSNVLVAVEDGKPVPKVIDFGIAKATEQNLVENTYFTEAGQIIGTPAYMSPEQAGADPADIDTRTDVYSLGALLYELLVGAPPFDPLSMRQAALAEIQRIIREVDPPKPSTRLSALGAAGTTIAASRGTETRSLARSIRGDLDWIVMKCLEKDRNRRYETANGLVVEISRFLANEPVQAGPPSASYRVRKFVRRNRGPVAAALVVALVLVGGLVGTSYGLAQAVRAREAEAQQRLVAEQARDEAEAVTKFLTDMLGSADPGNQGKDVTVREVLDRAAEGIGESFSDKPLLAARLWHAVGWTYRSLGLYDKAESQIAESLALYTRELGADHPRTLASATAYAVLVEAKGDYHRAEDLLRSTLDTQRRLRGDEHEDTLTTMLNLANSILDQGRYAEAEDLYRQTLDIRRRLEGEEDPDTLQSMHNLAASLSYQGRHAEAEKLYRQTLEVQRRVLGEEHLQTLAPMNNLGNSLYHQGRNVEAGELYRQTLEIQRRMLGEMHPDTLKSMNNLANSLAYQGRNAEAEELYRQTLELRRRVLGEEHPDTLRTMNTLASTLRKLGRYAEAEKLLRQTLELRRRVLGEEHPDTVNAMDDLASTLHDQGRYAEAEELHRKTLEVQRRILGEEHRKTLRSMNDLAACLQDQGRYAEAEEYYRRTLDVQRRVLGDGHAETLFSVYNMAAVLADLDQYDRSEALALECYERNRARYGDSHAETVDALKLVIKLYDDWHAAEPDQGHAVKAAEWRAKLEEPAAAKELQSDSETKSDEWLNPDPTTP